MPARNILSVLSVTTFILAYSAVAKTSPADLFTKIAEQSRHLAEAGKWDEAKAVLEEQLTKTKDAIEAARLKAELAHYAADRNTYFHKDESSVLAALDDARSAVQATGDKQALATLEMAEGRFTYWKALDKTKDWGPPKVFVPFALIALAEFEAEQKNAMEAIKLVEQALPLAESGNSPRALYLAQLTLAKWYAGEGKTAEAKKLAEQSRAGAEAFGNPGDMKEAEDFLQKHT
jgi:hypothetical protein